MKRGVTVPRVKNRGKSLVETIQGVHWRAHWVGLTPGLFVRAIPSTLNTAVQFPRRSDRNLGITLIYRDFGIEKGTCPVKCVELQFHASYTFQI